MLKLLIATNNPGKMERDQSFAWRAGCRAGGTCAAGHWIRSRRRWEDLRRERIAQGESVCAAARLVTLADEFRLRGGCAGRRTGAALGWICRPSRSDRRRPPPATFGAIGDQTQTMECSLPVLGGDRCPGWGAQLAEGVCEGEIILEERGNNGFGYDPIFLITEMGKTMAELSMVGKTA